MQLLFDSVAEKMEILSVAARYNPKGAFHNIALLYDIVIPLLKSRLVSEPAVSSILMYGSKKSKV